MTDFVTSCVTGGATPPSPPPCPVLTGPTPPVLHRAGVGPVKLARRAAAVGGRGRAVHSRGRGAAGGAAAAGRGGGVGSRPVGGATRERVGAATGGLVAPHTAVGAVAGTAPAGEIGEVDDVHYGGYSFTLDKKVRISVLMSAEVDGAVLIESMKLETGEFNNFKGKLLRGRDAFNVVHGACEKFFGIDEVRVENVAEITDRYFKEREILGNEIVAELDIRL